MGMAALFDYTAREIRALNDRRDWGWPRYEVVEGELLVTPAPRSIHQRVVARMLFELMNYLRREPVGEALASPADISWGPKMLVQPDVFVVPIDEARKSEWTEVRHLLLAVEVLSPASWRADNLVKRRLFQREGVPLYWIVDADRRAVYGWTPDANEADVAMQTITWHPAGAATALVIRLEELFRPL